MNATSHRNDLLAATVVLLAVAAELALREMYYRVSSEIPRLVGLAGLWLMMVGGAVWTCRIAGRRWRLASGRLAFCSACAVWLVIVGEPALSYVGLPIEQRQQLSWGPAVLFLVVVCFSFRSSPERWTVIRRAVSVGAFLFVASQPVLASLRAPTIYWPQMQPAAAPAGPTTKSVTVFLLLDELNANAAQPIADALRKTGREVKQKVLIPVGDATAKVIPAMFAQRAFEDAKPCGLRTICSGGNVLDFSKVIASRPDIDVVGFYGPYCAMQGLRSCAHLFPASPVFDAQRWWCAALRRSAWLSDRAGAAQDTACAALGGRVWGSMVSRVEQAIWQAPAWREGGFLFAHVPLPHPPGEGGDGSISTHYHANLARAVTLVNGMVERLARDPQQRFTIAVFSDHPLRPSVWCQSTQYRHRGCPFGQDLVDDKVPLIVAGDIPAGFDNVTDNGAVFRLAAQ